MSMRTSRLSVIVPVRRPVDRLQQALASVLSQGMTDVDVILTYAASETGMRAWAEQTADPRVRVVEVAGSPGLDRLLAAGLARSDAPLATFLEVNHRFCVEALSNRVARFDVQPDADVLVSGHVDIDEADFVTRFWQPPLLHGAASLLSEPDLCISDVVVRREWALRRMPFRSGGVSFGGSLNLESRLALLLGRWTCLDKFDTRIRRPPVTAGVGVSTGVQASVDAIESLLDEPGGPAFLAPLRDAMLGQVYMEYACQAYRGDASELARNCFRLAVRHDRTWIEDHARRFRDFVIAINVAEGGDESVVRRVFAQLPPEFAWLADFAEQTVGEGHLRQALWSALVGRTSEVGGHASRAAALRCRLDRRMSHRFLELLPGSEAGAGVHDVDVLRELMRGLEPVVSRDMARWIASRHFARSAVTLYRRGRYSGVTAATLKAIMADPRLAGDRGLQSVLMRSLWRLLSRRVAG